MFEARNRVEAVCVGRKRCRKRGFSIESRGFRRRQFRIEKAAFRRLQLPI
jgi:hypothetical protein